MRRRAPCLTLPGEVVDPRIGHRHHHLGEWRRDPTERLEGRLPGVGIAIEDEHDREGRLAMERRR